MLSSRNIHFALLGLILGASAGYVFAFVNAERSVDAVTPAAAAAPAGHPDVSDAQLLEALREAVEKDPKQADLVIRYATALFDAGRIEDAVSWFEKAVQLDEQNLYTRSMYGAALWQAGQKDAARQQLERAAKQDPQHVPSLHGLMLLAVERNDRAAAAQYLERIEKAEPGYEALTALRTRFNEAFGGGK